MITVLGIMTIGIVLGFFVSDRKKLIKINNKLTIGTIYLLLFLLGIGVGTNDKIIQNIHNIGLQAIVISLGAIFGSLICSYFVYQLFFKKSTTPTK